MPREGRKEPSPEALALLYLRSRRCWSQKELAAHMGLADYKQISRYETGEKQLSRRRLRDFAAALGYSPEAVEALLFIHAWIEPDTLAEPESPLSLSPGEHRSLDRASLTFAWSILDAFREELGRAVRNERAEASRRKAEVLWGRLKAATRKERRDAVAALPELQDWALAERVCHESEKAAAHKVEIALELADLALYIAGRIPGDERWRSRVEGYCWAYVANARRVANDYRGADTAFAQAWKLWRGGAAVDREILAEWRLLEREAALRRAQHRFPEALDLLEQAKDASNCEPLAIVRILLVKETLHEQTGDIQAALATLKEVAPRIEELGDARVKFMYLFKTINNLHHLQRYEEAELHLPQVRELAVQLGNELDLIRVVWLIARVAAGKGKKGEAIADLEQVRQSFTARELAYDAALASLELGVLYLEEERTAEVRNLARSMGWIFQAQGIAREGLAALKLFVEAAQRETATVELARGVTAELKRMRASAPPHERSQRGQAKG
jgi:transcriptional regulator with XRE-family HTH domain